MASDTVIGWAGSELASLSLDGDRLTLRLAVAHAWRGVPAAGGSIATQEEGYLPAVECHFSGAHCCGDVADAVGALHDGQLHLDGLALDRLPLPFDAQGEIRLALQFGNRAALTIGARGLALRQVRDAGFLTSMAC